MNKRKLDKYEISSKRYKELCAFCEQYSEWKEKLSNEVFISAVNYNDDPKPANHDNSDTTARHALRMLKMKRNCDLIERIAKEATKKAGGDLWKFIIKSACYEVTYRYMKAYDEIPIERSTFFEYKRYFFYLLDREKD